MGLANSIIVQCGSRQTGNVAQLVQLDLIAQGKSALVLRAKAKACSVEANIGIGQQEMNDENERQGYSSQTLTSDALS